MAKKTALNDLAHLIEKGLAAVASDIADIKRDMATKEDLANLKLELKGDIARVQQQVNSAAAGDKDRGSTRQPRR
jgi:hypothetical protein